MTPIVATRDSEVLVHNMVKVIKKSEKIEDFDAKKISKIFKEWLPEDEPNRTFKITALTNSVINIINIRLCGGNMIRSTEIMNAMIFLMKISDLKMEESNEFKRSRQIK